ncbi:MAG: hypothetical protein IPP64_05875 [Bacteroidetes bacterium]|nr:hypothetical protein [Bacteroidota bacterium]
MNRITISMNTGFYDFSGSILKTVGSMYGLAPRLTVSLNALRASSTHNAINFTPSPCLRMW